MCRIVCERRNGWTLKSFCRGQYSAVCTKTWRLGFKTSRCVSPQTEWVEKVIQETACCVDATVKTKRRSEVPEADNDTRAFCMMHCDDAIDREREFLTK